MGTLWLLVVAVFVRAGGCLWVSPIFLFRLQLLPESIIYVQKTVRLIKRRNSFGDDRLDVPTLATAPSTT